jgi:hypothetical protein
MLIRKTVLCTGYWLGAVLSNQFSLDHSVVRCGGFCAETPHKPQVLQRLFPILKYFNQLILLYKLQ